MSNNHLDTEQPTPSRNQDLVQAAAASLETPQKSKQPIEIFFEKGDGLEIKQGERNLYHVSIHGGRKHPSLTIYGGYDSHGPQLPSTRFTVTDDDFDVFIGGQYSEGQNEWNKVRLASDGKLFHSDYYRFESKASRSSESKKKIYWQKTHDSKCGSSLLAIRDFKLIDELTENVVAVYNEQSGWWSKANTTLKGNIYVLDELGDELQATAMLVLLTMLCKANEDWKDLGRALSRTVIPPSG
jgi:hypothetical protein